MQKELYGLIFNGILETSEYQLYNYKPVVYAEIPVFDQSTEFVVQSEPIDRGDDIFVGIEIRTMQVDSSTDFEVI